jgi:hypothetical protein
MEVNNFPRQLIRVKEADDIDINEVSNNPIYDEILNGVITDLEVYEAIQNLKKTKEAA